MEKKIHREGTSDKQTDIATTRPTRPRGAKLVKKEKVRPLGEFLKSCIVHHATVKITQTGEKQTYIGLTANLLRQD